MRRLSIYSAETAIAFAFSYAAVGIFAAVYGHSVGAAGIFGYSLLVLCLTLVIVVYPRSIIIRRRRRRRRKGEK